MPNPAKLRKKVEKLISDVSIVLQAQQRYVEEPGSKAKNEMKKPRAETLDELQADIKELRPFEAKLIAIQKDEPRIAIADTAEARAQGFVNFKQWMLTNAPDSLLGEKYDFDYHVEEGCGVVAMCDLKEEEVFLKVPRKLAMSSDTCLDSAVGAVVKNDNMCLSMPSLALALHLLVEGLDEKSFWKPYINVLPPLQRLSLPMLFSDAQLSGLQGSPTLYEALKLQKSTLRQYIYLQKLLKNTGFRNKIPSFNYNDFRWAVSVVMTRQNQIPRVDNPEQGCIALLPAFDFLNYRTGPVLTYFNDQNNCTETAAMRATKKGEPLYIHYGGRPNSKLFLFSGFVTGDHPEDSVELSLHVATDEKADPILKLRKMMLTKLGMTLTQAFSFPDCVEGDPSSQQALMSFCRIATMDRAVATVLLTNPKGPGAKARINATNEYAALSFLATALQTQLAGYGSTQQEDVTALAAVRQSILAAGESKVSTNSSMPNDHLASRLCIEMRMSERVILGRCEQAVAAAVELAKVEMELEQM